MTNPYAQAGQDQLSAPVRKKLERNADRIVREENAAREQDAEAMLDRLYKQHRKKLRDAFEARHPQAASLRAFLRKMGLGSAPALIAAVRQASWLQEASDDDRWFALNMIGHAMANTRIKAGAPPFDDEIFDQPPKAFSVIKEILRVT